MPRMKWVKNLNQPHFLGLNFLRMNIILRLFEFCHPSSLRHQVPKTRLIQNTSKNLGLWQPYTVLVFYGVVRSAT